MTKIVRKGNVVKTFKGKFTTECNIIPFIISGIIRCDRVYISQSKNTKIKPMIE